MGELSNWEIDGDVIREYRGLVMQCGAEILHHGHANHPLVRAAMCRGGPRGIIAAIRTASAGHQCFAGPNSGRMWKVSANGHIAGNYTYETEKKTYDLQGWPVDVALRLCNVTQIGFLDGFEIRDHLYDGQMGPSMIDFIDA